MPSLPRGDLLPRILTPPPGPRSRQLAKDLAAIEAPGIHAADLPGGPIVWSEARGANVLDADGNRYLDFTAGFGVASVGHRAPEVVRAVRRQAGHLLHGLGDVSPNEPRIALAQRLAPHLPIDDPRLYPAISGSDAVEIALKTALLSTRRPGVLAFDPGYHGLTLGALAATSRPAFREPFAPRLAPHVHRLPFGGDLEPVGEILRHHDIGAVLVEPVVGREGTLFPPPGWLAELAQRTREAGALLIADEIFTGFGRTGPWFAVDHEGVRPDLIVLGKALGGGLPLGMVAGRREIMDAWPGTGEPIHTATFLAHPLAASAALAVLDLLEAGLIARVQHLEERFAPRLASWASRWSTQLSVRGRGALWGLELSRSEDALHLQLAARSRGLLLLAGGPRGAVLQIAPPFVLTDRQLTEGLDLLENALHAALDSDTSTQAG